MRAKLVVLAAAILIAPASCFAKSKPNFVTVQPAEQFLGTQFIGQPVTNEAGETVGNINDLLFDKTGRIMNVVIGVGGFLGIGEKNVAIPYGSLEITADGNGKRVVRAPLSKPGLSAAPEFKPTEKTTFMRAKDQASELSQKAYDKAGELKDKAAKQIEDMRSK